ncbi:hypothetical protein HKCCE2091_08450 [Rhodobacterales bacterium HKCCE2091]|nr:hypothetical protein [Rhodobacterales bacterium HKCCE2091]
MTATMANGPKRNDSLEIMMLVGALSGLCLMIAAAVTDLSLRTAREMTETEQVAPPPQ